MDAGLVTERAQGTRRVYRVNPVALLALRDRLDTYRQRALSNYADLVKAGTDGVDGAKGRCTSRATPRWCRRGAELRQTFPMTRVIVMRTATRAGFSRGCR